MRQATTAFGKNTIKHGACRPHGGYRCDKIKLLAGKAVPSLSHACFGHVDDDDGGVTVKKEREKRMVRKQERKAEDRW